jgi:DNA-binding SARP family transcriptional activator
MRLALMGVFALDVAGTAAVLPLSAQRLLAFLALANKPLSRLYVAGHLWGDVADERAAASLRSALWRVRRAGDVVRVDERTLELSPAVEVDIDRALVRARRISDAASPLGAADVQALCRTDDILPDWYDEPWLELERECFRKRRLGALEHACERLVAEGRLGEALEAGLAAVSADPLRESAHRALIRMHLAEGNAAEAVRQFRVWERLSDVALGLAPSAQLRALVGG